MKSNLTNKKLKPFMSFGKMPLANGFLNKEQFRDEYLFEMEVAFCEETSLFQLINHPKPEMMFGNKYPFYTASSQYMKLHFKKYAEWLKKKYLKTDSKLIEIGSNDGTFLKNFEKSNINYLGFEPSINVAKEAKKKNVRTLVNFFNLESIKKIPEFLGKTNLVCASNVICHIPDLDGLLKTLDKILSKDGIFVFEEPYLGSMFQKVSYDQIYDEHIYVFSLSSVKKIFDRYDFELIDALPQVTHGGSMRYVVGRKNFYKISDVISKSLDLEQKNKLDILDSCLEFKKNCENSKYIVKKKLEDFKNKGMDICGYAATSKSTTVLNYCKIGSDLINFICDTTLDKIGKYSPGMHIPIKSINHFKKNQPKIAYLFAWNHKEEIFNKEREFTSNGGKWFSHVTL